MVDQQSEELPPSDITRWLPRQKWQVVDAVRRGHLTLDEACERYQLSPEEFLGWEHAIEEHGIAGLKLGHLQLRRGMHRAPSTSSNGQI
jgi:hypothetical protein